ncbi:helix-turn-helix domain-containing protein [Pedobacter sp. HMF7647]|uniref:Helix-turn-helix domain-containing protein n=1 Tax=Hufsiella arboris TaxID=2695275 RepID=A0A7K1Y808_9SPHI|nr:AraC family transcriptional regulator [Hufsiella arboris]MXV50560.1 helix-turn-helix domain-containing protein [Hufsiella arboris]
MIQAIFREVTPLTKHDCFTVFSRSKESFNFPIHYHDALELNLILNAGGSKRVVGEHEQVITDNELVLVGPNVIHGWMNCQPGFMNISETTIQFHPDLLGDSFLRKNQMRAIKQMLEDSQGGIAFPEQTISRLASRIISLKEKDNFDSIIELISILHDLAVGHYKKLSVKTEAAKRNTNSELIEQIFDFMHNHFRKKITVNDVAAAVNVTPDYLSRFLKMSTGFTFPDNLNEVRIGHVSHMLIETTHSIAEIAYACGFNNLANFNKIFRVKKNCTPGEFRQRHNGNRVLF